MVAQGVAGGQERGDAGGGVPGGDGLGVVASSRVYRRGLCSPCPGVSGVSSGETGSADAPSLPRGGGLRSGGGAGCGGAPDDLYAARLSIAAAAASGVLRALPAALPAAAGCSVSSGGSGSALAAARCSAAASASDLPAAACARAEFDCALRILRAWRAFLPLPGAAASLSRSCCLQI